jgi:hypothetical protein
MTERLVEGATLCLNGFSDAVYRYGEREYVHGWTVLEQRRSSCRRCDELLQPTLVAY